METIDHVLLSCLYSDEVWRSTCLREIMTHCANLSFVDVVDQIVQRKNDPQIAIFFTTNWMIAVSRMRLAMVPHVLIPLL